MNVIYFIIQKIKVTTEKNILTYIADFQTWTKAGKVICAQVNIEIRPFAMRPGDIIGIGKSKQCN